MSTQVTTAGTSEPTEQVRSALEERIQSGTLDLPLLPQVASQVMSMMSDPNADAAGLSTLIHQDQSLAGHVLRIANSPAYMPRTPIVSLQQAIAWLGMNVLGEIAFTISLQKGVFSAKGYEAAIQQLWRSSLITSLYAKEVARQRRHNVESAFLCGLLHAIGKPVILHAMTDLQKETGTTLAWDAVEQLLGEYHTRVGIMIADTWNLPGPVKDAIAFSEDYTQAPSPSKPAMIACLASCLARHLLDPAALDEQALREHSVVQALNLYPEDLTALLEKKESILGSAESMAV